MSAKHTSGEWTLVIGGGSPTGYKGNYEIAEAIDEEHEANARLIAAAPEMLEALSGMLETTAHSSECIQSWEIPKDKRTSYRTKNKVKCLCCDRFEIGRTAIRKARGE